ncbi:hypothetical protein ACH4S8_37170 [Streptomyces sp. NPDC021080]|uniref:hypothetical protein n=1 Tax=Streptomyces sp. NPDC021080 TaxID=3365110 RepID=UPI0037B7FE79
MGEKPAKYKPTPEARADQAKTRQETAERLATSMLITNHPGEYERLVDECLASWDRSMSKEGQS